IQGRPIDPYNNGRSSGLESLTSPTHFFSPEPTSKERIICANSTQRFLCEYLFLFVHNLTVPF
ncbi:hypothetical protein KSS87_001287, partial [Heliosperma pusillum]